MNSENLLPATRVSGWYPGVKVAWGLSLAFILFACVGWTHAGTTVYLSPSGSDSAGNGSLQRPWATIRYAIHSIPDNASEIVLLDGLYRQRAYITRRFTQPVRIRGDRPCRAQWTSPAGEHNILYVENGANLIFSGVEMFGQPGGAKQDYLVQIAGKQANRVLLEDNIIHDSYCNDLIKINDFAHGVVLRNCVLFNQADSEESQLLDVNTVTDVRIKDCVLFNDFHGSGRPAPTQCSSFVVVKNSGSGAEVTKGITIRRNIFLGWEGRSDETFFMLGEDGKPFMEAQDVLIENNLFIHNSPLQTWGTLLYKGGLKDVTFRANTVVGHPAVKWTGAMAVVCCRIEKNPPMGDLIFANNIFSDPTGQMPRFSISGKETFAASSKQVLLNNLYWNAGKTIPTETKDVLKPVEDSKKIVADPRLPWGGGRGAWGEKVTLPRWDPKKETFLSGQKTIRQEFERLVKLYGTPRPGSPAIHAANPADMPKDDILGNPRARSPTSAVSNGRRGSRKKSGGTLIFAN